MCAAWFSSWRLPFSLEEVPILPLHILSLLSFLLRVLDLLPLLTPVPGHLGIIMAVLKLVQSGCSTPAILWLLAAV